MSGRLLSFCSVFKGKNSKKLCWRVQINLVQLHLRKSREKKRKLLAKLRTAVEKNDSKWQSEYTTKKSKKISHSSKNTQNNKLCIVYGASFDKSKKKIKEKMSNNHNKQTRSGVRSCCGKNCLGKKCCNEIVLN